jgi:flagellar basal body-associated protein FliL
MVAKLEEGPQEGINGDSILIMVTVTIVMTALAVGTVFLVMALAP